MGAGYRNRQPTFLSPAPAALLACAGLDPTNDMVLARRGSRLESGLTAARPGTVKSPVGRALHG